MPDITIPKEIPLPNRSHFDDQDGTRRYQMRVRWWRSGETYQDVYIGPDHSDRDGLNTPLEINHQVDYPSDEKPLFIGHYWLDGRPRPLAANIACLDYSVARPGGKLVAYRWSGEQEIQLDHYVWCDRRD